MVRIFVCHALILAILLSGCAPLSGTPVVQTAPQLPDLAATVTARRAPRRHASYPSPGGTWQADILIYDCVELDNDGEYAYEQLLLTDTGNGSSQILDDQLIACGGLGAAGLEALFWSPDGRFFYYTDAREGVPDGCGFWQRPIIRLEPESLRLDRLGGGPVSPDGMQLATWQGRELVVWDVNGGEVGRVTTMPADAVPGPIAWAPDGQTLVYLQGTSYCPLSGLSTVMRLDLPELVTTQLLVSDSPTFGDLSWQDTGRLTLYDAAGDVWQYDLATQQLLTD